MKVTTNEQLLSQASISFKLQSLWVCDLAVAPLWKQKVILIKKKKVVLLSWTNSEPPLWYPAPLSVPRFRRPWCVVASSDIGNGTHFALIPLSHSLDAPQDPWLLFSYFLPQLTNCDGFHLHLLDIPFIYQFYSRVTTLVESTRWKPVELP